MERPGATERDEREVAWIVTAFDRDDAERAQHLGVHDLDRVRPDRCRRAPAPQLAVELEPARQRRRQPAEQEVGVRDGRSRAAVSVAGGPGIAPALSGPTRSAPPASRQTIEPPPAPTVWMSTIGSRIGKPPTVRSAVRSALPPTTSDTSVEVPPMSKAIAFSIPARSATRPAPTVAAGGPGDEHERGMGRRVVGVDDAARRSHHERLRQAGGAARLAERAEVASARRPEVGVRGDGRGALVLAELGRDLVRGDDVGRGVGLAQMVRERALVRGIAEGEEEADGDRLALDRL